jgi:hypothetical protein
MDAYDLAYTTDPTSSFGGIIAFNRELDGDTAADIIKRQFVEVIIAPTISLEAQAAGRINAAHLPRADTDCAPVFTVDDGVGFNKFSHFPGK